VPADAPRAAAAAVRHGTAPGGLRNRLARAGLAAGLRTGGRFFPARVRVEPAGSAEAHLRALLGTPVSLGIQIGPTRANRKPVLQLLTPAGEALGYAKLGTGALTRQLVRAETDALNRLSGHRLRQLTVPRVRHAGQWRDHALLVQSAVPVWRRHAPLCPDRLALAMRELAYCCGTSDGPLGTSQYWHRLRERLAAVAGTPEGGSLAAVAAMVADRAATVELRFGAWHGDWAPWNMATLPDTLLVWDWERFGVGVPVGFDAVHFHLQSRLRSHDPATAVTETLAACQSLLAPFHQPPAARQVTAQLYLLDLAARYLADRQAEAGARLGALGTWLLPALVAHLEALP
jgi:hypothetical protein